MIIKKISTNCDDVLEKKINNLIDKINISNDKINRDMEKITNEDKTLKFQNYINKIEEIIIELNLVWDYFISDLENLYQVLLFIYLINKKILELICKVLKKNINLENKLFICVDICLVWIRKLVKEKIILRNLSRIAILSTDEFLNAIDTIKWMISNKVIPEKFDIIMYDTNKTTALEEMKKIIFLGYRCVFGTQTSGEVYSLVSLLNENKDNMLYFNSYSTANFYGILPDALDNLPSNIIRTALIDDELIYNLFNNFLFGNNFYELLKLGNHIKLAQPLEISGFTDICYIYQSSTYTDNYLNALKQVNSQKSTPYGLQVFELTNVNEFPQELINLLSTNPVSNPAYKSSEKTLFIVNSSNQQSLLDMFDNELYGDNYIIFGDPFFDVYLKPKINFQYAFVFMGNFSELGYKYSKFIDIKQNVSPMGLGIIDIIQYFSQIYFDNQKLSIQEILELLIKIEYLKYSNQYSRDYWFKKQLYGFNVFNDNDDKTKFDYSMVCSNVEYNPTETSAISTGTYTDIYTGQTYNYMGKWSPDIKYSPNDYVSFPSSYSSLLREYLFVCKETNLNIMPNNFNDINSLVCWRVFPLQEISQELIYQYGDYINSYPKNKGIYKFMYKRNKPMFEINNSDFNEYTPPFAPLGSNFWSYVNDDYQLYQPLILYYVGNGCKLPVQGGMGYFEARYTTKNSKPGVGLQENRNWKLIYKISDNSVNPIKATIA